VRKVYRAFGCDSFRFCFVEGKLKGPTAGRSNQIRLVAPLSRSAEQQVKLSRCPDLNLRWTVCIENSDSGASVMQAADHGL
jgi:hypothetical protein